MKQENVVDSLVLFLTGMVAGAGIALILAPQSGKKTRRQLRRKAEDAQDSLEELGEDLIAKGRELVKRGKQATDDTIKSLENKAKEVAF